jgi:hypothetical protein
MRGRILFTAAMLWASAAAAADEPPICADRPGKATSTCTVPLGDWQFETGLMDWTRQNSAGERDTSLALGETTIKYGVSRSSDIEVDVTPWQRSTSRIDGTDATATGVGDVDVLYKQRLTSADAAVQVSVKPFLKIPTARHSLGNREWEGGLLLPVGYSIAKTPLSIALTPELDWAADADGYGHHAAVAQALSLGWAATDQLNVSVELWAAWDWDPSRTTRQHSADFAVAYLVSNEVQLDGGANFGLSRDTPGVELYAGVSKRFRSR